MTRRVPVLALCATSLALLPTSPAHAVLEPDIVVLQDTVTNAATVAQEHGSLYGFQPRQVFNNALKGYSAMIDTGALPALRADPRVKFVTKDQTFAAIGQTKPTGVNRVEADLSSTLSGNGSGSVSTPIAIIDSGSTHTDLNVVGGKACSVGSTSYTDGNGHGTHVAGIAAAKDDSTGVVGVAPGAPIWSVRVLGNSGTGTTSELVCGVDWVTANAASKGIKVANMSIAGGGSDDGNCGNTNADALHNAICGAVAAGVTFVVGAGNANQDFQGTIPAAYDEVVTVTAIADFNGTQGGGGSKTCQTEVDDTYYDLSNYTSATGPDAAHTIAAPGVCIYSTMKGGKYATYTGTSQAAPHVAGAAALCIASGRCAGLSPSGIASKLRADAAARPSTYSFTGSPFTPFGSRFYGHLLYVGGY